MLCGYLAGRFTLQILLVRLISCIGFWSVYCFSNYDGLDRHQDSSCLGRWMGREIQNLEYFEFMPCLIVMP